MLALIAQYLCTILGMKVLVLVPSEILKLDQTRCYCPTYHNSTESLYDDPAPRVYYQCFNDVLADGRIPVDTIFLIDEFHEFLKLPAVITTNRISCPYMFA